MLKGGAYVWVKENSVVSVPVPADNMLQCVIIFGGVFMHLSVVEYVPFISCGDLM